MYKNLVKYLSKHVMYNSIVHVVIGLGLGIILARPVFGTHPVRWGLMVVTLGVLGHLYPLLTKGK